MVETEQLQPCATITHQENGIGLLVEASMRPGMIHWNPEQAGEWFAGEWQAALAVLHHKTLAAFVASEPNARMVHHDGTAWTFITGSPSNGNQPAEERTIEPPLAADPAPLPESTATPVGEVLISAPTEDLVAPANEREEQVFAVISRNGKPVSRADIRRATGFSYEQINTSMKRLRNEGRVSEVIGEGAGRWKGQALYTSSVGTTAGRGKRGRG